MGQRRSIGPLRRGGQPAADPRHLFGPPPSEDFTFDGDGYLLALDSARSLVRVARGRVPTLVAPNVVANGRGLRVLAAGDVVIADQDRSLLVRVDPAATRRLTTTIANPNGLALGPGGTLWATDFGTTGEVFRVDADSGEAIALARPPRGSNGLAFSPDYRMLYVGDHDTGALYRLRLEPDGRCAPPSAGPRGWASPTGWRSTAAGTCTPRAGRRVYQVSPAGEVRVWPSCPARVRRSASVPAGRAGRQAASTRRLQEGGVYEIDVGQPRRRRRHDRCAAAGLATVLLASCGEQADRRPRRRLSAAGPADTPATAAVPYRRCPLASKVGEFLVERAERFTAVSGSIAEAAVPGDVRELVEEVGGCRLLRRRLLACFPACAGGMTCGEWGRCVRYPDNLDAGTVGGEGLRCPVRCAPTLPPAGTGTRRCLIRLSSRGPPFTSPRAGARCPAFSLVGGACLRSPSTRRRCGWSPTSRCACPGGPAEPGPARVELDFAVDQHGMTP